MGKCGGGGASLILGLGGAWRRGDLSQPPSEVPCRQRLDQTTESLSNAIASIGFCVPRVFVRSDGWTLGPLCCRECSTIS